MATTGAFDKYTIPPGASLQRVEQLLLWDSFAKTFPNYPAGGIITTALLEPDYVAPWRGPELLGIIFSLGPIALAVVILRLVAHHRWPGLSMGMEDYMIIPAAVGVFTLPGRYGRDMLTADTGSNAFHDGTLRLWRFVRSQ
jgi:hypothetical protein